MATTKMLHPAGQIPKRSFIQRPFTANIDHPDTQTNDMNGEYYFWLEFMQTLARGGTNPCAAVLAANKKKIFTKMDREALFAKIQAQRSEERNRCQNRVHQIKHLTGQAADRRGQAVDRR